MFAGLQDARALRLKRYGVWTQRTLTTSSMFISQLNHVVLPRFVCFFKYIYSATGQFMGWFFSSSGSQVRSLQGLSSRIPGLTTSSLLNRYFQPYYVKCMWAILTNVEVRYQGMLNYVLFKLNGTMHYLSVSLGLAEAWSVSLRRAFRTLTSVVVLCVLCRSRSSTMPVRRRL